MRPVAARMMHGDLPPEVVRPEVLGLLRFCGSCSLFVDGGGSPRADDGLIRPPHRGRHEHSLRHPRVPRCASRRTTRRSPRRPGATGHSRRPVPRVRAGEPVRPWPLPPPSLRSAAVNIADQAPHRGAAGLLPQPDLPTPHLRGDAYGPPRTARPAHAAAWRGAGQGRPRLRRCRRRASPRASLHAGKPRDRAAARHPHADARYAGSHPGRHRRLGDQEGQPLRHDRRRPRPSPRRRSPAGSHGTHGGRLARTASRRRTRRPGSLDRVRARRKPRRSPGATGRRLMAPSH